MASEEVDVTGSIDIPEDNISSAPKKSLCRSMMSIQLTNVNAREWLQKRRESVQPWSKFLSTARFKVPKSVAPVGKRIIKNIDQFQSNYLFIFIGLFVFCILTSPMLLVAIAASLGACYIVSLKNAEQNIKIAGRELSLAQQYAAIGAMSFPLFWIAGAGSAVFWIIGASFFVIMLHASLYSLDEEVAELEELQVLEMESV